MTAPGIFAVTPLPLTRYAHMPSPATPAGCLAGAETFFHRPLDSPRFVVYFAPHLELAIGGYPMNSLKTRDPIAAKPRAHAMKTRTRTHIAPPPRNSGASGIS